MDAFVFLRFTLPIATLLACLSVGAEAQTCGSQGGGGKCKAGECCSQHGYCGSTKDYCGEGNCQSQCPSSGSPSSSPSPSASPTTASGSGVGKIVTADLFDSIFPNRNPFYSYESFVSAGEKFSSFGTTGNSTVQKREVAAFFAHVYILTTGLIYISDDDPSGDDCQISEEYPCAKGQQYYGRGPIQLAWNYNYGPAGEAIGHNLLSDPDLVAQDPVVSFETALWFWNSNQLLPMQTCHNIMAGNWSPTTTDILAGRLPGFGLTINIIYGAQECGPSASADGIAASLQSAYENICATLKVDPGENLNCSAMIPYWDDTSDNTSTSSSPGPSPSSAAPSIATPASPAAAPMATNGTSDSKGISVSAKLGAVASGVAVVILVSSASCYFFRKGQTKKTALQRGGNSIDGAGGMQTIKVFSLNEVKKITNNFGKKIGEGGFGPVYIGNLDNGSQVAVKVNSETSGQGQIEFSIEVSVLSRIHHKNLVNLVGLCEESNKRILVYEFMEEGTLQDHLYGKDSAVALDWPTRLQIAIGAARGLEYLHYDCHPQIIHRDVKSNNILLNKDLQPKMIDFGISKFNEDNRKDELTTAVKGTFGYLDPEYFHTNYLTFKSDVYSFGVVLLEIISGQAPVHRNFGDDKSSTLIEYHPGKPRDRLHKNKKQTTWNRHVNKPQDHGKNPEGVNVAKQRVKGVDQTPKTTNRHQKVRQMISENMLEAVVDQALGKDYDSEVVWKVTDLAMQCVNPRPIDRPTMRQVVKELEETRDLEICPVEAVFSRNSAMEMSRQDSRLLVVFSPRHANSTYSLVSEEVPPPTSASPR